VSKRFQCRKTRFRRAEAITLIIGTLQGAKVLEVDVYDTLITKAALHGEVASGDCSACCKSFVMAGPAEAAVEVEGEGEGGARESTASLHVSQKGA
jgi:vacuolar protein sorting-associated protein 35